MYYEFDVSRLPSVHSAYSVYRRTVWQIVDPYTILLFAAQGRCRVTLDNQEYLLSEGSLLIIPGGMHYIRRPVGDEFCTLYYLHLELPGTLLEDETAAEHHIRRQESFSESSVLAQPPRTPHLHLAPLLTDFADRQREILSLYEQICSLEVKTTLSSCSLQAALVVQLLAQLAAAGDAALSASAAGTQAHRTKVGAKLQRVFAYIRLHSKEEISLDDLCAVCNFSKQHLIRVFSARFGMTPKAYIQDYRMNCAKEMFYRNPELSVKEVANEMGFADQHYFSRLFAKHTGISPTAFKQHLIRFDPAKQ